MRNFLALLQEYRTDTIVALKFFTRLPWITLPGEQDKSDPSALARSLGMAPLIGIGIGILGGVVIEVTSAHSLSGMPAALLTLFMVAALTGALHEDGLADTADGLGAGRDRDKALSIMQDSRIGTFGVLALIFSLGLRAAALSVMPAHEAAMAFIAAAALSRALPAGIVAALGPARADGLGSMASAAPETAASRSIIAALIGFIGAVVAIGFVAGVWSFLTALCIGIFVVVFARHRLGGYTGDVLGAAQQLSEITVLLLCAAVI